MRQFFTKRFHVHKKHQKAKQATFTLLKVCVCKKLLPLLFSVCLIFFCWLMFDCDVFLYARNLFIQKKINRLEIVLITSSYYATLVFYPNSISVIAKWCVNWFSSSKHQFMRIGCTRQALKALSSMTQVMANERLFIMLKSAFYFTCNSFHS